MALTKKEIEELEMLDNPDVEFFNSSASGIFSALCTKNNRKERVVELRTKMRMGEENIDTNDNWPRYYEIQDEEEKRFNERFGRK